MMMMMVAFCCCCYYCCCCCYYYYYYYCSLLLDMIVVAVWQISRLRFWWWTLNAGVTGTKAAGAGGVGQPLVVVWQRPTDTDTLPCQSNWGLYITTTGRTQTPTVLFLTWTWFFKNKIPQQFEIHDTIVAEFIITPMQVLAFGWCPEECRMFEQFATIPHFFYFSILQRRRECANGHTSLCSYGPTKKSYTGPLYIGTNSANTTCQRSPWLARTVPQGQKRVYLVKGLSYVVCVLCFKFPVSEYMSSQ
jgi:hypothetical protein